MAVKVSADVLEDVGWTVDLGDMIRDGHRYFKGGTNRPFPAWEASEYGDLGKFLVELAVHAGDPECKDIDEWTAAQIGERLMIEPLGRGFVFGFPGVELT